MSTFFCPKCKHNILKIIKHIYIGKISFYHHVRYELFECVCNAKIISLYYFEEERHGYDDTERHYGSFLNDKTFLEMKEKMEKSEEVFKLLQCETDPYNFEDFFPFSFEVGKLCNIYAHEEVREKCNCISNNHYLLKI